MTLPITKNDLEYGFNFYKSLTEFGSVPSLLMESKTQELAYGRRSIVATNLALKVTGKNNSYRIEALTDQGLNLLDLFSSDDFPFSESYEVAGAVLEGTFDTGFDSNATETERIRGSGVSKYLRALCRKFETSEPYVGLYGAFAYDFVRHFEDIGDRHKDGPGNDFTLFLPGDVYVFDEVGNRGVHYSIGVGGDKTPFEKNSMTVTNPLEGRVESMSDSDFKASVSEIRSGIIGGRFMQCVLSKSISLPVMEAPFKSYSRLRDINPSPYCFFFNFGGGEFLYGSSPEIHAVVENGKMVVRPLAGTQPRTGNPLNDAKLRREFLKDKKERSEHLMLVDLSRSEVYRLCEPRSVSVTDTLTIEEYPNLYHLASGVEGTLKPEFDSIDVLLTTLPAGTLSGSPKKEAMRAIEELEPDRRGYYGGAIGYLGFDGDCNTGITIRSVHVVDGRSTVQAGAGIVLDSNPENELDEINLKLSKPLKNLERK
tara:strand:- start:2383 stop:3831 length:1449 start_codon:yes stop_codon:yes gene_type:complete